MNSNNDIVPGFDFSPKLPWEKGFDIRLMKIEDIPGCLLLYLQGYVFPDNANYFNEQILRAIDSDFNKLIFHLAGFKMVSDVIIGCFTLFLKRYLKPRKGDLVLFEVPPKVYEVFQLLGFSQFFNITETLEEAVAFFKGESTKTGPFPKIFKCPICSKKLKAHKAGKLICSECRTILAISEDGSVLLG